LEQKDRVIRELITLLRTNQISRIASDFKMDIINQSINQSINQDNRPKNISETGG